MHITQLTLQDLRPLQRLLKKKQVLQSKIDNLNRLIERITDGRGTRVGQGFGGPGVGKISRHGELKTGVVEALQHAGKSGLHIKEIASSLQVKEPNIRVWFYSTGKKIKNIKKVGRARYAWVK